MADPKQILERARTIAVVGIARTTDKPSGGVPADLQRRGFRIIPVNPKADEILGEKAYASLADVPEEVDVVEVFRPAEEAPEVVRQAVAIGAKAVWLQLGIESDDARRIAEDAGIDFVQDRCMAVESRRHDIRKQPA
ncbi:MAG TPA: CoA-binding protein [Actinomycetota bacterium]|nr:CoA-binding protein [Actinomycetota bacterium]